jgi:glycosyltransferase involved in cell wall biosynthesis
VQRIVNALAGLGTAFSGTTLKGRLLNPPVRAAFKRLLGRPGSRCILQNPEDAAAISQLFPDRPDLLRLIRGSGVDLARFTPLEPRSEPRVALFVGRLLKDKGVLDFCQAAALVHVEAPALEFWVVGGPDPGNPASLREADLAPFAQVPNLRFLGQAEAMAALYRQGFVLVLPTRYGEGVPRSLVEGAACGLPLIATDHPGCREIVRPGVNGYLVPPGDPPAIAAHVLTLARNPVLRDAFGRASRRHAEEAFSFEHVFRQTLQVYAQLGLACNRPTKGVTP